jgi:hypothetical protein
MAREIFTIAVSKLEFGKVVRYLVDVRSLGFDNVADFNNCPGNELILRTACQHRWPEAFRRRPRPPSSTH